MHKFSKALVNNFQEFSFNPSEVEQPNLINLENNRYHLIHENRSIQLHVLKSNFLDKTYTIEVNGNVYDVKIKHSLDELIKKMGYSDGSSKTIDSIKAPMPGIILAVDVEKGQAVKEGDTLVILEAMKMENAITCPKDTVIKDIYVAIGDTVDKNKLLINFE